MIRSWEIDDRGAYIPSPEEIKEGCKEVQATWSPAERKKRTIIHNPVASIHINKADYVRKDLKVRLDV